MEDVGLNSPQVAKQQISSDDLYKLKNQATGGANWFLWIAGLSLINSAIIVFGGSWNFIVGLATTQIIDGFVTGIATEAPNNIAVIVKIIGLILVIGIAGVFALFGILGRKQYQWAFIVGMIFYALDGLIFLLVGDILSVGFHLFALLALFGGLHALRKLKAVESGQIQISDESIVASQIVKKPVRDRKFWLRLIIPILIILVPFFIYLAWLLSY